MLLTQERLKFMPQNHTFASGIHTIAGAERSWIAVTDATGGWSIIVDHRNLVKDHDIALIKELVPCDANAFRMYNS